jgi:hypothetical protein
MASTTSIIGPGYGYGVSVTDDIVGVSIPPPTYEVSYAPAMSTPYKVGDKIRLRKDLILENMYGLDAFTSQMVELLDRDLTIVFVSVRTNGVIYKVDGASRKWNVTHEMIDHNFYKINVKPAIGKKISAQDLEYQVISLETMIDNLRNAKKL